jgi:hypothetical protein
MTQDEIIEMAIEAGNGDEEWSIIAKQLFKHFPEETQRFAKLVAQHEREACAKIAETPIGEYEVVVACGTEPAPHRIPQYANWQDIATAIRARGQV